MVIAITIQILFKVSGHGQTEQNKLLWKAYKMPLLPHPEPAGKRDFPLFINDQRNHFIPNFRGRQLYKFLQGDQKFNPVTSTVPDTVEIGWVNHYASGLASGYDVATAMTNDRSGNIYVTGYSSGNPFGLDCFTAKYDPSGRLIWASRYDGQGSGDDFLFGIVVDSSAAGNIYVTGYSRGTSTGYDYVTIRYSPGGAEEWVSIYNGSANANDYATAVTADKMGNVYVTGFSADSSASFDYLTIKYLPNGITDWVARYDGPANASDKATVIALDEMGNVYVAGGSTGSGTSFDYATLKYNFEGVEQWVVRYNGTEDDRDIAIALAVESTQTGSNIYVSGSSKESGSNSDYTTIKYNSEGIEQWTAHFDGVASGYDEAVSLAVDNSGNICVTGLSESGGGNFDYATVKYSHSGIEQWNMRFDSSINGYDQPTALELDYLGNIYVTGLSEGSGTNYDYATVKYNAGGSEEWVAYYNNSGDDWDLATDLLVDSSGNVYVTGFSGWHPRYDIITLKYNAEGSREWIAPYDGPGNSEEFAVDLTIDHVGSIYITGYSARSNSGFDYATIKYSPEGIEEWIARYDGFENSDDYATALDVDDFGNVYVTGYSYSHRSDFDYATVKYNQEGIEQWAVRYDGPANSDDRALSLTVEKAGNVYVTGYSYSSHSSYDYATIKYNTTGDEQWVARYNGSANDIDLAQSLAFDSAPGEGNIYVTGLSNNSGTFFDYITIKYNSNGAQQWTAQYDGPANYFDNATALKIDNRGNIYVTGESFGLGTSLDYATIKYNSKGVRQWVARYNGPANDEEKANALTIDNSGNVYITGYSYAPATAYDYATVKYNSDGLEQWAARYDGPRNNYEEAKDLAVDRVTMPRLNTIQMVLSNGLPAIMAREMMRIFRQRWQLIPHRQKKSFMLPVPAQVIVGISIQL
jgi:uncharacterized delta-60 repeat protein